MADYAKGVLLQTNYTSNAYLTHIQTANTSFTIEGILKLSDLKKKGIDETRKKTKLKESK